MNDPVLTLNQVRFRYPGAPWSLDIARLDVLPGERVGIIGPNGSGKSTLLKLGAGVLRPDAGGVSCHGTRLDSLDRRAIARCIAFLPQTVTALFDFTVEEVVWMGRYPHGEGFRALRGRRNRAVESAIEATGLGRLRTRPLSRLSGGEYKRALLASVIAQEPELLLLDEPTAALDVAHQVRLHRLLVDLSSNGMAVLSVTHDLNLASLFFDRLILLEKGRVACQGSPESVLSEDVLSRVYGEEVLVSRHPAASRPVVLPQP